MQMPSMSSHRLEGPKQRMHAALHAAVWLHVCRPDRLPKLLPGDCLTGFETKRAASQQRPYQKRPGPGSLPVPSAPLSVPARLLTRSLLTDLHQAGGANRNYCSECFGFVSVCTCLHVAWHLHMHENTDSHSTTLHCHCGPEARVNGITTALFSAPPGSCSLFLLHKAS